MEKNCLNCKYYYCNKCNNKHTPITIKSNIQDQIIDFIEEGYLSQALHEELNLKRLGNDFLSRHIENNYVKKNCIDKALNETYEEDEYEIYEGIENIMSDILLRYFKDDKKNDNIKITTPGAFRCCNWE